MTKSSQPPKPPTVSTLAIQERLRKDRDRIDVITKTANGVIKQVDAASILHMTPRNVGRLVHRYNQGGIEAILHQARGKPSNHQFDPAYSDLMLELIRTRYSDCGPTLVSEELHLLHGFPLMRAETVRRIMMRADIWVPNDPNTIKHRQSRERRPSPGQLVQMDTSVHEWLGEELGPLYMIAMIDDATSRILVRLYKADSTLTNLDLLWRYNRLYGRPMALYVARASHFIHTGPDGVTRSEGPEKPLEVQTQIQRAMEDLGIVMIFARSPQAKGRVERLFRTLQGKLIKMFAHRDISTIEQANEFLSAEFIPFWDKRYTVEPRLPEDAHRSAEGYDLDAILCEHEQRVVTNDYTFQYQGWRYQIEQRDVVATMRRNKITLELRRDGDIKAHFRGKYIHFYRLGKVSR